MVENHAESVFAHFTHHITFQTHTLTHMYIGELIEHTGYLMQTLLTKCNSHTSTVQNRLSKQSIHIFSIFVHKIFLILHFVALSKRNKYSFILTEYCGIQKIITLRKIPMNHYIETFLKMKFMKFSFSNTHRECFHYMPHGTQFNIHLRNSFKFIKRESY